MYILLPLLFIVGSIVGIFVIVYRKMPYLKKLTPESHDTSGNFVVNMFPEFFGWLNGLSLKEYKKTGLMEFEKILRRLRVVSLKIDRLSESLIKKVRKVHFTHSQTNKTGENNQDVSIKIDTAPKPEEKIPTVYDIRPRPSVAELKKREQQLIIEIAKSPKNWELYEKLGDLYVDMKDFDDAKEAYGVALKINPDNRELIKKQEKLSEKLPA